MNIGLIERGVPKLGVVSRRRPGGFTQALSARGRGSRKEQDALRSQLDRARGITTAVASKSHLNQATIDYLEAAVGNCGYVSVGSSLKFCIVAEGKADIYPRAAPTSEWDTAAGHAVLLAAGGLVDGPDGEPLRYGKPTFLNRAFVATSGWKAASARAVPGAIFRWRTFAAGRLGGKIAFDMIGLKDCEFPTWRYP